MSPTRHSGLSNGWTQGGLLWGQNGERGSGRSVVQVRAATNVPNLLEMSECSDRQAGTEPRALLSLTSSVQWTDRHCKWLPGWGAEALLAGRSWAVERQGQV
jgi:hypothetical protein